jgi:large-conductance mechanosensitive channel|tara:strand:- start:55 stop:294 length:240 start_codon:yes stop_codon:yes gene_type:complete
MNGLIEYAWTELKTTVFQLLPYAVMIWLIWTAQTQQQQMMQQHMALLSERVEAQTRTLTSIRDTLTQRGLVVPPLGETN